MRLGLVVGALTALVVQLLPVFIIAGTWVSARNATAGECGYDGNCVYDGFDTAVKWGWLLVVAVEIGAALLVSAVRVLSARPDNRSVQRSVLAGLDTICVAVCVGLAALVIVAAQTILIDHLANAYAMAQCPGTSGDCSSDTTRANLVLDWSGAGILVEVVAAVIVGQRLAARRSGRNRPRLEHITDPTDETTISTPQQRTAGSPSQ